jgi:hypothetical protein
MGYEVRAHVSGFIDLRRAHLNVPVSSQGIFYLLVYLCQDVEYKEEAISAPSTATLMFCTFKPNKATSKVAASGCVVDGTINRKCE